MKAVSLSLPHLQKQSLLGWGLILLVVVAYTWGMWKFFTLPVPGGNDFMAHYTAWEAYVQYGYSPYSDEAALYTQHAIYGRPTRPGEDQNRMTYPFYSGLLHAPFLVFDYPVARAIYMTLLQAALLGGMLMMTSLARWRMPGWLVGVVLGWSLLYYPEARGVILGQFAIFGFFSLAAALYWLKQGRDWAAGAVLVLATVKPTLVFLVIPFLVLWALSCRRWKFIAGFFSGLAMVSLGSLALLPGWISEWLYRILVYSEYTVGQSPVWLLSHKVFPALGRAGELAVTLLLVSGMLWTWFRVTVQRKQAEFYWALGITLVVSNLIVPRSATTNYVMMLVPVVWVFAALDRIPRWGRAVLLGVMLVSFAGLWWLHFATVVGNQEQPILFIPSPIALGLALVLGYRGLVRDARQWGIVQ